MNSRRLAGACSRRAEPAAEAQGVRHTIAERAERIILDFYSITLALALAATFGSVVLVATSWFARNSGGDPTAIRRFGRILSVTSLVLLSITGLYHLIIGHRPGSPTALAPMAFCSEHPALFVGAGAASIALILLRLTRLSTPQRRG